MKTTHFHTKMKKRITISIDENDFNWLKENNFKISPFVNALIKQKISMKTTQFHTNLEEKTEEERLYIPMCTDEEKAEFILRDSFPVKINTIEEDYLQR